MLEEVVVVGYGTMRKKDLTGSVVQIRPDKLANEAPKTVQDVLRGTPGLNIGYNADAKGGGTMMVRGQRSVYVTDKNNPANDTHNTPLIILDGYAILWRAFRNQSGGYRSDRRVERCFGCCYLWCEGCQWCYCSDYQEG